MTKFFDSTLSKLRFLMSPPFRLIKIIVGAIFCFSFISTLSIAFFVPIYVDEPQWKLIGSRIFLDNGYLIYLFPACQDNFLLKSPWTWYPSRWLDALIYADATFNLQLLRNTGLDYLRVTGGTIFVILIFIWSWIFQRVSKIQFFICFLFIASFFSIGVLPFLMVFNRPEQSILIWLTIAILLMLWMEDKKKVEIKTAIFFTASIGLLSCLIAASHPKGLYLLPALFAIWFGVVKKWYLGVLLLGLMLWTSYETIQLWQARTNCQESPWLTKILTTLSIPPTQAFTNFQIFWQSGLTNLADWTTYVNRIGFQVEYQSNWLRTSGQPYLSEAYQRFFLYTPLAVFAFLFVIHLLIISYEKNLNKLLLQLSLLVGLIGFAFMQINKNFYEAGLIWPVILLTLILSFSKTSNFEKKLITYVVLPLLISGGIYSAYERYALFANNVANWQKDQIGYVNETVGLKNFAKSKCNIHNDTKDLMLDGNTYPIFWQNPRPMIASYIFGWWATGTNYHETLTKRKPGGAVMLCGGLPKDFMERTEKQGKYCCLSGSALGELLLQQN